MSTTAGPDRLIAASAERTVYRCHGPAGPEVRKLLLRGSPADAEREVAMGRALAAAGIDVVSYLGAEVDPATHRPCVRMAALPGNDLLTRIGEHGAMAAAEACAMLAEVAATLAAMHDLRTPAFPHGVCHGDVKPGNIVHGGGRTVLLDFEHAAPAGSGIAAGTPGFAAPEAQQRGPLQPAFDIHALGATLQWLLCGGLPARRGLELQDPELVRLLQACTAKVASDRPTAAAVAAALHGLGRRLVEHAPEEQALAALSSCDLDGCHAALAEAKQQPSQRQQAIEHALHRAGRLCARAQRWIAATVADVPRDAAPVELARRLRRLEALLRRFPRLRMAVDCRHTAAGLGAERLAGELPRVFELVRDEDFDAARELLQDLDTLAAVLLETPVPLRIPGEEDPRLPSLLQRAPQQCLRQERQRLEAAIVEHERMVGEVAAAELRFAFDEAEAAIDRIASRHGGSSPVVARRRDRLHRLVFYVERIGRARRNIGLLHDLLPDVELRALLALCADCTRAATGSRSPDEGPHGVMGLRSLQFALQSLVAELPAFTPRTAAAQAELAEALDRATSECWRLLADAKQKLASEPVPVRPLQTILGRLDAFRTLEAIVDRDGAPRSELADQIESLRLRLEQARATRDRLARGAEQALAKGHWTTGLFDMERAVTSLSVEEGSDADAAAEAQRLQQRLAEARRRKSEIEAAQRRNVELQARHAMLQDDPDSSFAMRLQALSDRHDCLQFLILHAPQERGRLYARDLREVEIQLALERSEQLQAEFDLESGPERRAALARQALAGFDESSATLDKNGELPGRLQRPIEHWRNLLGIAEHELAQRLRAGKQRRRHRVLVALAGAGLCLAAIAFGPTFFAARPQAGGSDRAAFTAARLAADPEAAIAALQRAAAASPPRARAAAAVARLYAAAAGPLGADLDAAGEALVRELLADDLDAPFAADCWHSAVVAALSRVEPAGRSQLRQLVAAARARLSPRGIELPPDAIARFAGKD